MPTWSVRYIRAAFLALALGFSVGAALLLARAGMIPAMPSWSRLLHAELLLVGWFVQLVLGVAWWIFPRHARGAPRGDHRVMPAGFLLLNGGIMLYGMGVVLPSTPVILVGRGAEVLAVASVAAQLFTRIR